MDSEYRKKLWVYSVLVVVASICSFGSPLLASIKVNTVVAWVLALAAFILFIFATVYLGSYLKLKSTQWVVAIVLLLLAWVGSAIYMVTRKPNRP